MPASVMPIAMLREWVCIGTCQKNIYAYICLSYILCVSALSAASQWRRLLASVPSRNIGHQSAFFLPSSTFSSFASFFYVHIYCLCSDSAPLSTPDVVHKIKCRISELATCSSLLSQSIKYKAVTSISELSTRKPPSFLSILLVNHIFDSLPFK